MSEGAYCYAGDERGHYKMFKLVIYLLLVSQKHRAD